MELSPPDPRIGQLLQGRYRILSRVAAGAMGVVYRGERVELGRQVAVKFLHPWIAAHQAFRSRFENEARAMSRLSHPGCVSVLDFGFEGSPYLVMDFVTGPTLREILDGGRLPPPRAVAIARQLLAGMSHAHAQGIIHRDLKPENLILSDAAGIEDHLRILDFGLAKLRDGPAMTAGMAVGTPSYMSPEQTGAPGEIDGRTDIYAVGVLLFEMLAGRKPFVGEKVADILLMHRDTPPPLLRQVVPDAGISTALEAVVDRALAKLPEDRFQTAAEFAAALEDTPEAAAVSRRGGGLAGAAPAPSTPPPAAGAGGGPVARASARAEGPGGAAAPAAPVTQGDTTIFDARSPDGWETAPTTPAASLRGAAPAPAAAAKSERRRWIALAAGAALALALVAIGISRRPRGAPPRETPARAGDSPSSTGSAASSSSSGGVARPAASAPRPAPGASGGTAGPLPSAATGQPAPPPPSPAVAARLADADRLIDAGEWEQAVVVLEKARKEAPENAAAAYALANVCLEHSRWAQGAQAARAAGQHDARYRGDERLVKNLIRSLASDRTYERTEEVLRGFGSAAVPLLREAAAQDKSPVVRQRATEVLESRGRGGTRGRWTTSGGGSSRGASSTSGGGSFFKR